LINSSQTANDTRQILMSQALGSELNVLAGAKDPGSYLVPGSGDTVGHDLLSEAVYWLEGRNLNGNGLKFVYTDHSSGNTDANHNGTVDTAAIGGGTSPATDYNKVATKTVKQGFTFEGADGFPQTKSPVLTSSMNAWQTFVDTGVKAYTDSHNVAHDFTVDGEGLKNALQAFNQGQLVTSSNGQQVAWFGGGVISDVHMNDASGMWSVLKDAGLKGIAIA
jgi:hypothetical protein